MSFLVGLVCISRDRIAELSSSRVVEAPCIGVPPVTVTLVLGAGEEVRELGVFFLGDLKSDIRGPAAEGGACGVGVWTAGWF
jgi:hypothetical protein